MVKQDDLPKKHDKILYSSVIETTILGYKEYDKYSKF